MEENNSDDDEFANNAPIKTQEKEDLSLNLKYNPNYSSIYK
jgi:hypothetical protein